MPATKRQLRQRAQEEFTRGLKIHVKTAVKESGYTVEEFAKKLGMSRPTFDKRMSDPKQLTVAEVNQICKILPIEEKFERALRGYENI